MVSTLDVLTDGRTVLGIGAGSSQSEFEAYSLWDTARVRVEKTAEAVQSVLRLWTKRTVDFAGKYFRAKGAVLEPKPRQKPHPPLIFGGIGPRMLQIAGRYADICLIPISETDSAIAMRRSCEEQGLVNEMARLPLQGPQSLLLNHGGTMTGAGIWRELN